MSDEIKNYDLVIIGGGPAGLIAASTAKALRKRVAVIDCHYELGGAGMNLGTVPSKTLREAALALSGMKSRKISSVDLALPPEVKISELLSREQSIRGLYNNECRARFESHHADVFIGKASFIDAHTVCVVHNHGENGQVTADQTFTIRGECILIATGSSPVRPAIFPFGRGTIYDSDTISTLQRVPETMAVVGAGVIGSEYGCTFAALGTKVQVIDIRDRLLPFLDEEIARQLGAAMENSGMTFHWKKTVQRCEVLSSGKVMLTFDSGTSLAVDALLVATGRKGNTESLNLKVAGVTTGELGIIPVDGNYRTNIAHIYAAGDVIGFPALASTSMEQARRAVAHIFDRAVNAGSCLLPNGIYTIPEVSMVGETEESLQAQHIDYAVGRAHYDKNARGQIIGEKNGFIKLLVHRQTMQLLGVHVMGEQATELIHIGLMAMRLGAPISVFVDTCFNVPTLGELYKTAALEAIRDIGEHELGVPSFEEPRN